MAPGCCAWQPMARIRPSLSAIRRRELLILHSCGNDHLIFSWMFHGGTNTLSLWRANVDGSSPVRLTEGKRDFRAVCSPDGKWAYYYDQALDGFHACRWMVLEKPNQFREASCPIALLRAPVLDCLAMARCWPIWWKSSIRHAKRKREGSAAGHRFVARLVCSMRIHASPGAACNSHRTARVWRIPSTKTAWTISGSIRSMARRGTDYQLYVRANHVVPLVAGRKEPGRAAESLGVRRGAAAGIEVRFHRQRGPANAPAEKINQNIYGRASNIRLKGVCVALRKWLKPPAETTSRSRCSPACAPRASPTSCESEAGVQSSVDAP